MWHSCHSVVHNRPVSSSGMLRVHSRVQVYVAETNMRLASCSKHTSKGWISASLNKFAEAAGVLRLSHSPPAVGCLSFIRSGKFPPFSYIFSRKKLNMQNIACILSKFLLIFIIMALRPPFSWQRTQGFCLCSSWQGIYVVFLVFFFQKRLSLECRSQVAPC